MSGDIGPCVEARTERWVVKFCETCSRTFDARKGMRSSERCEECRRKAKRIQAAEWSRNNPEGRRAHNRDAARRRRARQKLARA
jgi:hypothetical protein